MDRSKGFRSKHSPSHRRPIDIEVSYERLVIYVSRSFRLSPFTPRGPTLFLFILHPRSRPAHHHSHDLPSTSPKSEIIIATSQSLAKITQRFTIHFRKSRLLEISFNRKPSSFPLGVCTLPNSLRGNCRSPLHSPLDNSSLEPRHFPSCLVSAHLFSSNSRERIISQLVKFQLETINETDDLLSRIKNFS